MTEWENQIVSKSVSDNTIKFNIRYVDDTLVLFKRSGVNKVMSQLNSFHKNLNSMKTPLLIRRYISQTFALTRISQIFITKILKQGKTLPFPVSLRWRLKSGCQ